MTTTQTVVHTQGFARGFDLVVTHRGATFLADVRQHGETVFMASRDTLAEAAVWAGVEIGIRLPRASAKEGL